MRPSVLPFLRCALAALTLLALAGCSTSSGSAAAKSRVYLDEAFSSTETFSRVFPATTGGTCEAARRALMSQGYLIGSGDRADSVTGRKSFQPQPEVHVQIEFHIVCVPEVRAAALSASDAPANAGEPADRPSTIAFVSAVQDRYSLKKSSSSASLGVSAIGSVSLPLSSNDDSLVKVASETIPAGEFYDRFFQLVERYLEVP
ncbi:DUF2242 domain-containing protein [Sphaerotilus uruguayifluvii]|uniref:DUF2242 domain-containing protein n=1 Tax=Sphaerotilus uruguayifluvii TaxID=2735897 RepID=A0ABX2G5G5_9BURK|nr:DUF2242 domain-containing protein [Leptothrix sp. C29]NRT57571.1 hypothetical protein [Leptothrix sp. C29]